MQDEQRMQSHYRIETFTYFHHHLCTRTETQQHGGPCKQPQYKTSMSATGTQVWHRITLLKPRMRRDQCGVPTPTHAHSPTRESLHSLPAARSPWPPRHTGDKSHGTESGLCQTFPPWQQSFESMLIASGTCEPLLQPAAIATTSFDCG